MSDLADRLAGKFIVIDGPDGSGKTTQLQRLRDYVTGMGLFPEVVVDPGTTRIGKEIRHLLLDRGNGDMAPMCEALLFMASRAQLIHERIRPALELKKVVLCDRYVSATIAYQGAAGIDPQTVLKLAEMAISGFWPDLTVILDVPVEIGLARLGVDRQRLKRPTAEEMQKLEGKRKTPHSPTGGTTGQMFLFGDRWEYRSHDFHEKVRAGFKGLASNYPGKVREVDAAGPEDQVFQRMLSVILEEFGMHDSKP